jgi:hypothetical protein
MKKEFIYKLKVSLILSSLVVLCGYLPACVGSEISEPNPNHLVVRYSLSDTLPPCDQDTIRFGAFFLVSVNICHTPCDSTVLYGLRQEQ